MNVFQSGAQVSSIIFVDLPAGTGFSYAKTLEQSDWNTVHHAHQFLRKVILFRIEQDYFSVN